MKVKKSSSSRYIALKIQIELYMTFSFRPYFLHRKKNYVCCYVTQAHSYSIYLSITTLICLQVLSTRQLRPSRKDKYLPCKAKEGIKSFKNCLKVLHGDIKNKEHGRRNILTLMHFFIQFHTKALCGCSISLLCYPHDAAHSSPTAANVL